MIGDGRSRFGDLKAMDALGCFGAEVGHFSFINRIRVVKAQFWYEDLWYGLLRICAGPPRASRRTGNTKQMFTQVCENAAGHEHHLGVEGRSVTAHTHCVRLQQYPEA